MKTIFIVSVHGDEQAPLKVIKEHFKDRLKYLVAHPEAFKKNVRYLTTDLNRSFPGRVDGSKEERIVVKLMKKLNNYERVIDLHTATCDTLPFAILTKVTKDHLKLVSLLGLRRVVCMEKNIASGKALIDHIPIAISVECGNERSPATPSNIKKMIDDYLNNKSISLKRIEYYTVFEFLTKKTEKERLVKKIQPFKLVKKGEIVSRNNNELHTAKFNFYPILPREKNYKDILCLMAKKVCLKEFKEISSSRETLL
ncbi:hypothetical protein COT62_00885 [Candidatus Roizmanbacteria bacterium CG09_land_8_20_14_0_10_41_9]|uniref:Succinylglutamate desuccinylase/Aspartoacylase catalytic domain-containing protein n=1 Tax=Candidatus Roizmanbacteria bacterium CG09_land_8_20_14_0_10_41_9 TaxID=1974850 RepID=A0A2H0WTM3_9BACT|nr:MAG: hypothetical protein COT62_00885 [Candidatus Roizmanbacteria bacterium CG09_land_8_20_14_0_10_41_9]